MKIVRVRIGSRTEYAFLDDDNMLHIRGEWFHCSDVDEFEYVDTIDGYRGQDKSFSVMKVLLSKLHDNVVVNTQEKNRGPKPFRKFKIPM